MHEYQYKLLRDIMALDFTILELALYLDTHPRDKKALKDHNEYVRERKKLKEIYEEKYGPLTLAETSEYPWRYIADPWPWEIKY